MIPQHVWDVIDNSARRYAALDRAIKARSRDEIRAAADAQAFAQSYGAAIRAGLATPDMHDRFLRLHDEVRAARQRDRTRNAARTTPTAAPTAETQPKGTRPMSIATPVPTTGARIAPGVYFGLDERAYHADAALGSGDIRALYTCPMYYWTGSAMNPHRVAAEETPALLFGRALHALVLEGREAFLARYLPAPEASDFPGCLVTVDDIKAALRDAGEKLTGNKPDLIARLKAARPGAVILDEVLAEHAARAEASGATIVKRAMFEQVIAAGGHIAGDSRVAPAFQGGCPEISVFWEADGVPLKCRLDYLRFGRAQDRRLIGLATDLKSFANQRGLPPERAVAAAIAEYRLDMQAAHNLDGAGRIPDMIRSGAVFGAERINADWLTALSRLGAGDFVWHWAFYQKDAPVTLLRSAGPALVRGADRAVEQARQSYRDNMQAYGTAWRYSDPMPDMAIDAQDMPAWLANAA